MSKKTESTRVDLTPALFSMSHRESIRIKLLGEVALLKMPKLAKSENGMVTTVPVVDLDTGEEGILLVPAIFESVLDRFESVTGLSFELENLPPVKGKLYRNLKVYQLAGGE